MATIKRPQLVLQSLQYDGNYMTHESITVRKTNTMTYGTLLKANKTEASSGDLGADVVYVIDDHNIDMAATGSDVLVTAVAGKGLDWVVFRKEELKLGSTALTSGQITTFGKKVQ